MSVFKAIRVLMTLGVGLLIFLTLQYLSGTPAAITTSAFPSYQDAKDKLHGAFSSKPKDGQSQLDIFGTGTGFPEGYAEEAHKLSDADGFLTHLKAVVRIPGISMNTAKAGCDWDSAEQVNFQYDESPPWVKKDRTDGELDMHRRAWHKFVLNDLIPYKDHSSKWDEKGIVIVAGGAKGREQIKVILKALDKLQSALHVEVHFWDEEITQADQQELLATSAKVSFNNLKDSSAQNIVKTEYNAFVHNYQLKTAAVLNSKFSEVLLLDSDNIPVIAPETLFDSGVYKEYGTVFWPDIARTRPNNPIWAITNTICRKDEFEQESGQLLVNKHKYFYHLQLAAWMMAAKQNDYYNKFLLGDKDTFRFAWHALRTRYGKPHKWTKTVGMVHGDTYCGHSFAQHHPDSWNGSIAFIHAGLTKLMPKDFLVWQQTMNGGIFQAFQAAPAEEDPMITQSVGLKIDELKYWSDKPESIKFVQCNDMYGLKSKPLDDVLWKFDAFFEEIGGYTMLENFFGGKEP